ncbi:hypothetical protein P7C73_g6667, partial [Tremellales sp. Uapishka_1]
MEARKELEELVQGYTGRSDWIHLVVSDSAANDETHSALDHLVPVSTLEVASDAYSSTDPTPRCESETDTLSETYFSREAREEIPFLATLHEREIRANSIQKFLSWRLDTAGPAPLHQPLQLPHAPSTATASPASSQFGESLHLRPTVARASGGGEWEAGLSRRVAKRKESVGKVGRARRGSLGKKRSVSECFPLFPNGLPVGPRAGVGLKDLVDKTFAKARKGMDWRRLVLGLTVVCAVGWGCWWVAKRA